LKSALGIKNKRNKKTPAPPFKPSKKSERDEIIEQLEAADHEQRDEHDYELPPLDLLLPPDEVSYDEHEREVRRKARILQKTFKNFGFNVKVVEIETGPVIAQYEIELEAGLRLSKITGLADDLAIALRVPSVRIVAPIPGKNTVGIEVPNEHRQIVRLREVIEEANGRAKRLNIPIFLGKDVSGNPLLVDLAALPHLLIAGRTGTGKSVCLNSIIVSMLMGRGPDEIRMLMIDPKMVELSGYQKLPHLMHPVVTDMRKAEAILAWAVDKMEERYQLLARAGVRHVSVFNQLGDDELRDRIRPNSEREWEEIPRQLPFIVIVADEIADLMMTAGKDVEQHIIRLAQKSRAVGIHLILATQKPTVDVITGLIKSNLPARIAFQVASRTDSRVVLDEMGAEKLLGNGDMLFLLPGTSTMLRGQGTYLSDDEISRVVDFVGTDDPQFAHELLDLKTKDEQDAAAAGDFKNRDELYEAAVDMVVRERRGSVSLLQRSLGIGYGRAARLIDFMAEDKIVGEYNGSQAREVLISLEDWEAMTNSAPGDEEAPSNAETTVTKPTKKPRRTNKIVPEIDEPSDLETEVDALAEADAPFDADEEDADEEDAEEEDAEEEDEDEEWEDDDEVDEDEEEADDEDDDEEWEYEEVDESDEEELADDEEWVYEDDEEEEDEEVDEELEDEYEDEEELADQA
jgi:S-DNA-T family DNA segregation ATPase FtsK/SpoIIIE